MGLLSLIKSDFPSISAKVLYTTPALPPITTAENCTHRPWVEFSALFEMYRVTHIPHTGQHSAQHQTIDVNFFPYPRLSAMDGSWKNGELKLKNIKHARKGPGYRLIDYNSGIVVG